MYLLSTHFFHSCVVGHPGEWSGRYVEVWGELCEGGGEETLYHSNHTLHVHKRHFQINLMIARLGSTVPTQSHNYHAPE